MNYTTSFSQKVAKQFVCEKCDYACSKKNDFKKHTLSIKHNATNTTEIQPLPSQLHTCGCGKHYSHRASLFNHKKKCTYQETPVLENTFIEPEKIDKRDIIIEELVKTQLIMKETNDILKVDNHEMKNLIMLLVEFLFRCNPFTQ